MDISACLSPGLVSGTERDSAYDQVLRSCEVPLSRRQNLLQSGPELPSRRCLVQHPGMLTVCTGLGKAASVRLVSTTFLFHRARPPGLLSRTPALPGCENRRDGALAVMTVCHCRPLSSGLPVRVNNGGRFSQGGQVPVVTNDKCGFESPNGTRKPRGCGSPAMPNHDTAS